MWWWLFRSTKRIRSGRVPYEDRLETLLGVLVGHVLFARKESPARDRGAFYWNKTKALCGRVDFDGRVNNSDVVGKQGSVVRGGSSGD